MTLRCQAELYLSATHLEAYLLLLSNLPPRLFGRCLCQTSLHDFLAVAGRLPEVPLSFLDGHRRMSMGEIV